MQRLIAFVCLFLVLLTAHAYPDRPIKLIVTYPPGGGNDIIARLLGQKLSDSMGQPVVVENHAGAGGTIGTARAAKSPPDGYAIVLVSTPFAMAAAFYPNLPYDTFKDLAPITLVGTAQNVLVVHPSLPAKSVAELIAYAKANPTKISAGTLGGATTQHLAAGLFNQRAKTEILLLPYKGSAPAMNDLLGGQVQMMFNAMPSTMPYVKAGRLRALAVTGLQRSPEAPELPTVAETLPGYEIVTWWGLLAPAGTPQPVLDKLYREIRQALERTDVKAKLTEMGVSIDARGPAAFAALTKAEIAKWSGVIRLLGVKPD
ncbi:MAG TPA: tripartite tricarboxylate transporter substrate binding protein [Burkholderiales bacterium]|nr:tripartite tricarboxylate transporter substrate binding protein [Burkholderiales bacterium]